MTKLIRNLQRLSLRNITLIILSVVLAATGIFLAMKKQRHHYESIFEYKHLRGNLLAQSGDLTVTASEINDLAYRALNEKRAEILAMLAYKQFVLPVGAGAAVLGFPEPRRSLKSICNQYGVSYNDKIRITFQPNERFAVKIGENIYKQSEINRDNIFWLAVESEIFQYSLLSIEAKIKEKALYRAAKKRGETVQGFVEQVLKNQILEPSQKDVDDYLALTTKSGFNRDVAAAYLRDLHKKNALDAYLEKKELKLPILVNMQRPEYKFDLKYDWTPSLGNPKSHLKILVVGDFFSDSSQRLISQMAELHRKWPNLLFGFQPYFQNEDRFQRMVAEMSLCVWSRDKDHFWDFLKQSKNFTRENVEEDMYLAIADAKMALDPIKKCFLSRQSKEAVDYHLKYADYLGIKNAPVIFIGQEVFLGPLSTQSLENTIARQAL
jgi:hypothetical protein